MKNKGFTLVELLAMLVVMGILIGIAIPNISGIVGKQKENAFKSDINSLVERVKVKVAKEPKIGKPNVGECFIFTLDYLNDEEEFQKGPSGGDYEQFDSFIVYTAKTTSTGAKKYNYYVRLVEKLDGTKYGIDLKEIESIDDYKEQVITTNYGLNDIVENYLANHDGKFNYTAIEASSLTRLNSNKPLPSICTSEIKKYYMHRKM